MAIEQLGWDHRFAAGPLTPPALTVTSIRQGGCAGIDVRLADDPEYGLVRIVGSRAQLGPCSGLVGGCAPTATLEVDVHELPLLARLGKTWRERRIEWAGHVRGCHGVAGMYRSPALRYRAGTWERQTLEHLDAWREGEMTYVARRVESESFGPCRVELVFENRLEQRVGAVVRTDGDRCASMSRGSMVLSRRWVEQSGDYGNVADYLVRATSYDHDAGIGHLQEDAVEFDSSSVWLLDEAAHEAQTMRARR